MLIVDFVLPSLVVCAGYLVLGVTGFGSALIIVPLLANYWPLTEVVVLAILLDIPASILHSGLNLKQVQWRELKRLLPGMIVGALIGLWLLGSLDKRWPLFFLGIYVVVVGARALMPRKQPSSIPSSGWVHFAGGMVGVVEVMFATAGPIVVAWLQRRLGAVWEVRATVPVVMVLAGSIAVVVLLGNNQVEPDIIWPRWLWAIPIALLSVLMGNKVAGKIPPRVMGGIVASLLMISGVSLIQHVFV
tara:strand:+ start:73545 stop:74282 length:738 start_codon:yes stop_codon:yes gene_type:complete